MPSSEAKDARHRYKRVFICSPYRGLGSTEVEARKAHLSNIRMARYACRYAISKECLPYCPHLYFPRFLMDRDPDERELGIALGLTALKHCDEIWVIGRNITEGMRREIKKAKKWSIKIVRYVPERSPEERLMDAIFHPDINYKEMY